MSDTSHCAMGAQEGLRGQPGEEDRVLLLCHSAMPPLLWVTTVGVVGACCTSPHLLGFILSGHICQKTQPFSALYFTWSLGFMLPQDAPVFTAVALEQDSPFLLPTLLLQQPPALFSYHPLCFSTTRDSVSCYNPAHPSTST